MERHVYNPLSRLLGRMEIKLQMTRCVTHKQGELVDGVLNPRIGYKFWVGRAEFIHAWRASPASPAIQT